jgi:hypothetical protein
MVRRRRSPTASNIRWGLAAAVLTMLAQPDVWGSRYQQLIKANPSWWFYACEAADCPAHAEREQQPRTTPHCSIHHVEMKLIHWPGKQ